MGDATDRTMGQWWQHNEPFVTVSIDEVRQLGILAYRAVGANEEDAEFLLNTNLDKALQGDHARGIGRLPGIIAAARAGNLDLKASFSVASERGSVALVDCDRKASGRLACKFGMDHAIGMARRFGTSVVGVRAQAELLTPFVQRAVDQGMIGIIFNQSFPTVAAHGGRGPMLGNQPVAIGVPAARHDPVILDMSLTMSSAAGMFLAAKQNETVSPGLLLDEQGNPTVCAADFPTTEVFGSLGPGARGTLTALGGGHKGYALIFMFSLLSAALTNTDGPWKLAYNLPERGRYGSVLITIDPSAIMPFEHFTELVDDFIDNVKSSPVRAGFEEVLYPGEKSQRIRSENLKKGFFRLPLSQFDLLQNMASEIGAPALSRVD